MSRTRPNPYEQAMLLFGCEFCGAAAGGWCVTQGSLDTVVPNLHAPRWKKVIEVNELSGATGDIAALARGKAAALNLVTAMRDKLLREESVTRGDLEQTLVVLRRG